MRQSVTAFSLAFFSTLITQKLVYAIWGLCRYSLFLTSSTHECGMERRTQIRIAVIRHTTRKEQCFFGLLFDLFDLLALFGV